MNEQVTKSQVRNNFKYAREMMRQADELMKADEVDLTFAQEIAAELTACVATFAEWVDDKQDEFDEAQDDDDMNPLAVVMPAGAFDQQVWNAWTN